MFPESQGLRGWNQGGCQKGGSLWCTWCPGRAKSARVINYEEFKKALEELATKRFKGKTKEEAFDAICQLIAGKEPANLGVTVSALLLRWMWGLSVGMGVSGMGQVPSYMTLGNSIQTES